MADRTEAIPQEMIKKKKQEIAKVEKDNVCKTP